MPEVIATPSPPPRSPRDWLLHGQALENQEYYPRAVSAYDRAIDLLRAAPSREAAACRELGIAWMNRGNALQKIGLAAAPAPGRPPDLSLATAAYEEARRLFETLPPDVPSHRNHLGAACLNRGHALLAAGEIAHAIASFQAAIAQLADLPLGENPAFRLNLAGARANLAQANLSASPAQALVDARIALDLAEPLAPVQLAFAEMSLRARRTAAKALGQLLAYSRSSGQTTAALANEAGDLIDGGLALARTWEKLGTPHLRPLAIRLFRLGAQLYRHHQPHFLAEFLFENVDPAAPRAAFADDAQFRAAAAEALEQALADLQRPQILVAGSAASERVVATARELRAAKQRLSPLQSP